MPEIDDDYMETMAARAVIRGSAHWEDALQEARIARWLYRDKPNTYQVNQIVWRCTDMLRKLNGRRFPKPHVGAVSLDYLVQGADSHDPTVLSDMVEDTRLSRRIELVPALLDIELALQTEKPRHLRWLLQYAQGATLVEIGVSAGVSESRVAQVIGQVRKRLREKVA